MSIYHPNGKRVLICGDREWIDGALIEEKLVELRHVAIVVEGGAQGADFWGGVVAEKHGIAHAIFNANWDCYLKVAGPIRNGWMLKFGLPELPGADNRIVLAFHNEIALSKGTANLIYFAKKAGILVRLTTANGTTATV